MALREYEGAVVIVSHDRSGVLAARSVVLVWVFGGRTGFVFFWGGLTWFKRFSV